MVFSLNNRPKLSRASAPKSRNGCKECRRRHIKCDQARPYCMRCVKSGRVCEGYLDTASYLPPKTGDVAARQHQRILPTSKRPAVRIFKVPGYETALFDEQRHWDSFQSFVFSIEDGETLMRDDTAVNTPQFTQSRPDASAARAVCCGLGALHNSLNPILQSDKASEEYSAALEHCGRAMRTIYKLKPTTNSLPSIILSSLLFIAFEFLTGNIEAAVKHHNHSVALMWQYIDLLIELQGVPLERLSFSDMDRSMFDSIERLDTLPWIQGFGAEGIKVSSPMRNFPHNCRHRLNVGDIPERFGNVHEAFTWWHVTQHAMMHALHEIKISSNPTESQRDAAFAECAELLQSWHSAFAPLLHRTKIYRTSYGSAWTQAMTLEALYVETLSALRSRYKQDSNVLPAVESVYRELLRHCMQLARENQLRGFETVVLENSIIRPVVFVLFKTQDPGIVKEARAVLERAAGGMNMSLLILHLWDVRNRVKSEKYLMLAWGWFFTTTGCSSGAHVFDGVR
ncbi:hypothetical protein CPLU01_15973 [Colletotrichum plurivorum]|uniref:Zn(2)-C6 fungal-type domain-containing protein n=1 Tax=Colletotrichum plurivorum TaxID=2175906 RepID=A0A8H6MRK4_9PEZI|nr:hypothetical protein CPLU01_15973 [Colletotrichum plurivorum]